MVKELSGLRLWLLRVDGSWYDLSVDLLEMTDRFRIASFTKVNAEVLRIYS